MTRSRVSPDGRIAQRDVAAKLVIIMVGLPARGKSYITKKIQRYLSWQQHDTRIFNVGNRRRVAAGVTTGPVVDTPPRFHPSHHPNSDYVPEFPHLLDGPTEAAHILLNGRVPGQDLVHSPVSTGSPSHETMDQSAQFFDPSNEKASKLRTDVALSTLDELLTFLLDDNGAVGILDATNSTVERRRLLYDRIKARDAKLGILFIESVCEDKDV